MSFIPNPYPNILLGKSLRELSFLSYATEDGLMGVVRVGEGKQSPILKVGGPTDTLESDASREVDSTIQKTTKKEGLTTNPAVLYPSSFFSPIPPMIKGFLFSGPLSIIDNPEIVIALLGTIALAEEKTYTEYYRETPTKVIDNQALEDMLFES